MTAARMAALAIAALLAGCTLPTMPDPQTPADLARAMQVTRHTAVDGHPWYDEPVDGRCPDRMEHVRVVAWMEMAGQQVGGYSGRICAGGGRYERRC
jgi:hypothetical protein